MVVPTVTISWAVETGFQPHQQFASTWTPSAHDGTGLVTGGRPSAQRVCEPREASLLPALNTNRRIGTLGVVEDIHGAVELVTRLSSRLAVTLTVVEKLARVGEWGRCLETWRIQDQTVVHQRWDIADWTCRRSVLEYLDSGGDARRRRRRSGAGYECSAAAVFEAARGRCDSCDWPAAGSGNVYLSKTLIAG